MTASPVADRSPRVQAFELAVSVAFAAGVARYALGALFVASSSVRARRLVAAWRRPGHRATG